MRTREWFLVATMLIPTGGMLAAAQAVKAQSRSELIAQYERWCNWQLSCREMRNACAQAAGPFNQPNTGAMLARNQRSVACMNSYPECRAGNEPPIPLGHRYDCMDHKLDGPRYVSKECSTLMGRINNPRACID